MDFERMVVAELNEDGIGGGGAPKIGGAPGGGGGAPGGGGGGGGGGQLNGSGGGGGGKPPIIGGGGGATGPPGGGGGGGKDTLPPYRRGDGKQKIKLLYVLNNITLHSFGGHFCPTGHTISAFKLELPRCYQK